MSKESPKLERVHCNECGHITKHSLVATCTHSDSDSVELSFDMLECCGCESVMLRSTQFLLGWDPEECYYPPRASRRLPKWHDDLPRQIVLLLKEVYAALHADSRRLAMMGARALIDMAIFERVGDVGSFVEKLNKLESEGFVSKKNRELLEAALDVGNAASHRGHRPKTKEVQHVMDIVENLLQAGVLEPIAQELKDATPKRAS